MMSEAFMRDLAIGFALQFGVALGFGLDTLLKRHLKKLRYDLRDDRCHDCPCNKLPVLPEKPADGSEDLREARPLVGARGDNDDRATGVVGGRGDIPPPVPGDDALSDAPAQGKALSLFPQTVSHHSHSLPSLWLWW